MQWIDSLAYVSLPRFAGADEFVRVMDAVGVEAAVVATTEECPDLRELSQAALRYPDRLRAIGLPVGATPAERRDSITAQLEAGFAGVRISDRELAEHPGLLEVVGPAALYIDGAEGLRSIAEPLSEHLDHHPESAACALDFGGVTDPRLFDTDLRVRWLFRHRRFFILFTGPARHAPSLLGPWLQALLTHVGWERVLCGSEYPHCTWRDEAYAPPLRWLAEYGISLTDAQRQALVYGNVRRALFGRPLTPKALDAKWCPQGFPPGPPVRLSLNAALELPEEAQRRLFAAYQEWGGEGHGTYGSFLLERLREVVSAPAQEPAGKIQPPKTPAVRRRSGLPTAPGVATRS
jgi:hypothetical protein